MQTFTYVQKPEYNKTVRINNHKIHCISKKKITEIHPCGGYTFVGEVYTNNNKNTIGFLKIKEASLAISPIKRKREDNLVVVGYIEVGENQFVAVLEKKKLPIIFGVSIAFLIIALTVGLTVYFLNKNNGQQDIDPNIQPIDVDILTVSGTVYYGEETVENAEVVLYTGKNEIARTTTDTSGKYLLNKIKNGVYTIVVNYGKTNSVNAVIIDHMSVIQDFYLTNSDLTVNVNIADEKTPAISVNGLNEIAKKEIITGKHVDVTLVAKKLDAIDVPTVDKDLIATKSGETALTYFDFSIYREIFALNGNSESKDSIFETENPIEIIIPYDSTKDVGTYVFRTHNGEVIKFTELSKRPTENYTDGTYFVSLDQVYIYTKYFSTYAIGSASAGKITKGSDTITYSDEAYVNLSTKKIEMLYKHDTDSTNDARIEIYLVGNNGNLLISKSGTVPVGHKLETMFLLDNINGLPSVGTYKGIMKVIYIGENGNTSTNVDIPLNVAITK